MKTWTAEETQILIKHYNTLTNSQLAEMFPSKSQLAISKKARKLGLRKSAETEFRNRSEANRGEKSGNWNGGLHITQSGYRQVRVPDHPRADLNGYVFEHIVVWEAETGIPVPADCCIHHLNGNKQDNRIKNLCLMKTSAHTAFHNTGRKLSDETKRKISESRSKKNVK